ncbi:MAG: sulfite exporter TauE/SafE family protein [Chloroflexi bacterium]|nr:sulfite exporter TauE/SafE family protein [Chloroflexota bacterium]
MQLIIFFFIGAVTALFGTLVGVGGGFILIPVLLLIFKFPPTLAVGTSMLVIFCNAISGTIAYFRHKKIDIKSGWWFVAATFPGTVAGSFLTQYFTNAVFQACFGVMLVLSSISIFMRGNQEKPSELFCRLESMIPGGRCERRIVDCDDKEYRYKFSLPFGIFISFLLGFIAGAFGIGGGIIIMPTLILALNFPVPIAVATSHFTLAFTGFFGAVTHFFLGNVQLLAGVVMGIGAIIGAQFGAVISKKARSVWIARLLALALLGVGIRMIFFH